MKNKNKDTNNFNNTVVRHCAGCEVSEEREQLFEILLPPEIVRKTPYCRRCLDTVIDSSARKNRAKQRDK